MNEAAAQGISVNPDALAKIAIEERVTHETELEEITPDKVFADPEDLLEHPITKAFEQHDDDELRKRIEEIRDDFADVFKRRIGEPHELSPAVRARMQELLAMSIDLAMEAPE